MKNSFYLRDTLFLLVSLLPEKYNVQWFNFIDTIDFIYVIITIIVEI